MRAGAKIGLARALRARMTDAEHKLWSRLRARRLEGMHFRRQHPIGRYVVDFVCMAARTVVEVDGGQHLMSDADRKRDRDLHRMGFRVLRFWNHDVILRIDAVLEHLIAELQPGQGQCGAARQLPRRSRRGANQDRCEGQDQERPPSAASRHLPPPAGEAEAVARAGCALLPSPACGGRCPAGADEGRS